MFSINKTHAALVAGGFVLGTLGLKAVTSDCAKKLYVQAVAAGMRAKNGYDQIVEQAKAQVDDVVAEATYLNSQADAADGKADAADEKKAE